MNFRANPPWLFLLLGLITGNLFLVTPLSFLTPMLLAYLLSRIKHLPASQVFWKMFQFAFMFFAVHLWWLPVSLGELFGPTSFLLFALMLPILATMWGLTTLLTRLVFGRHFLLFLPFSWILMEHLRSLGPFQFTWGTLGYLWVNSPAVQIADLGGVPLLSLLGVLLSSLLADSGRKSLLVALSLLGGAVMYGLQQQEYPQGSQKVALVQGSIPPLQKIQGRQPAELEVYLELSKTVKGGDALVVWPETASPVEVTGRVQAHMLSLHPRWLVGAPRWEGDRYFNSVSAFSSTSTDHYDKRVLVPFGESLPLQGSFPGIYRRVFSSMGLPELLGVTPGKIKAPMEVDGVKYGTYICYESTFPDLTRQLVQGGAQVLVNLSNDSWFGQGLGAQQHFLMGTVRAIETRRYLLRAGNDGITAVVDPRGRTLSRLPRGERGVLQGQYSLLEETTPFVKYGNWVVLTALIVLMGALLFLPHREKR